MPIFIKLTDRFDHPIWINFQWVNRVFIHETYTVVSFDGGDTVHVKETPEEILTGVQIRR